MRCTRRARAAGVDAAVPSCPDWRVADLLGHVGRLHRWVAAIVESGGESPSDHWSDAEPPPEAERLEWFAGGVDLIADGLLRVEPSTPAWSWTTDNTAGFWARRQANETAVHRWDAQNSRPGPRADRARARGRRRRRVLCLLPYWRGASTLPVGGESIHLHATDGDGEWLVRLGTDGLVVTPRARQGRRRDARAPRHDLLLFLWAASDASRPRCSATRRSSTAGSSPSSW